MIWTNVMEADLKRYRDEGLSASQVALKLGRGLTRNAVLGKLYRLDYKPTGWGRKWAELHRQYTEAGATMSASLEARIARSRRIQAHIDEYPNKSLWAD